MRSITLVAGVLIAVLAIACGTNDGPQCVEVDLTCAPLYQPTFDNIYNNTLLPKCSPANGACHDPGHANGGISYTDPDSAYDLLLGNTDGRARVVPGDPNCSLIVERIESSTAKFLMPPGDQLPASERCAIEQWIADGAPR